MNIETIKNSRVILAGIAGLLFALVYVGLEFRNGFPEAISLWGDANTISLWHFPLIWLLAGILFYCIFYAIATIRGGKVRERAITFAFSVAVAVLIALYWLLPMLAGLYDGLTTPTAPEETNMSETRMTGAEPALPAAPKP